MNTVILILLIIVWLAVGVNLLIFIDNKTDLKFKNKALRLLTVLSGIIGVLALGLLFILAIIEAVMVSMYKLIFKNDGKGGDYE